MSDLYEKGVAHLGRGDVDLINDDISVILIDKSKYTVNLDTHEKVGDIPAEAQIAELSLTGKSYDGVFRANNIVFTQVPAGDPVGALVVFLNSGDNNTSWLLYYEDSATQWPITPDGTDININWDIGTNGIFKS